MKTLSVRLTPEQDLRAELERLTQAHGLNVGVVLTCVGSLREAALRLADREGTSRFAGPFEILALSGTLSPDGPHLHLSVSDTSGRTLGGYLQMGCRVYTTAELVLGVPKGVSFARAHDPETGCAELVITPRA